MGAEGLRPRFPGACQCVALVPGTETRRAFQDNSEQNSLQICPHEHCLKQLEGGSEENLEIHVFSKKQEIFPPDFFLGVCGGLESRI